MTEKVKVQIIESEAGWGQKVDETLEFDTLEEAVTYCKDYNTKHNPPMDHVPGWYMYARLVNRDIFGSWHMLRH